MTTTRDARTRFANSCQACAFTPRCLPRRAIKNYAMPPHNILWLFTSIVTPREGHERVRADSMLTLVYMHMCRARERRVGMLANAKRTP